MFSRNTFCKRCDLKLCVIIHYMYLVSQKKQRYVDICATIIFCGPCLYTFCVCVCVCDMCWFFSCVSVNKKVIKKKVQIIGPDTKILICWHSRRLNTKTEKKMTSTHEKWEKMSHCTSEDRDEPRSAKCHSRLREYRQSVLLNKLRLILVTLAPDHATNEI